MDSKLDKSEEEWREQLSPEEFTVLRKKGTERPFSGEYDEHFEQGSYTCKGCGETLFTSESKFNSGCGWPAFDRASADNNVVEERDSTHGMVRTEIMCANCGGHLGHVFNDGPTDTGLRYCVNSASLDFDEKNET
jgi:peptide-methionine (R)-S-oxide reductase